ncbi:MAG TPA: flagellar filament capping protein FliD, partial [Gemmatimonadaceae bacterium]|nr:flagellar filament capping protein FliD [Gemmatimonadaceae bacterium]
VAVGDAPALGVGSVVTIRGTRGDGGAVQASEFTVQADSTVDDLLAQITAAYGGPRGAQATLGTDGTIRLTDSQGGESKLSLSLGVSRAAGEPEAALLGRTVVETAGRLREVSRGADAVIRVDGSTVTRGGNTISDVIAGVTLSLQHAEPGTEIAVDVTRDDAATVKAIKDFAAAYNEIASFVKAQTAQGAPLAFNGTLRSTMSQITSVLLTDQEGLPAGSAFGRATLAGVSLTRTGTLEVDEKRLTEVMATNFADLKTLFGTDGVGGAMTKVTDILTRSGDGTIAMQQDSISTSITSLERRVSDAESRLELRREAMLRQFASMEAALARMQSQGNWLTQQVGSLPSWSQK